MKEAKILAIGIAEAIMKGLPGEHAHRLMLPEGRNLYTASEYIKSAVLILLFPKSGAWYTVFMKRNMYDGPHSGQISFPGGKYDLQDGSLLQTALRETFEETGIDTSHAEIAGEISSLQIPVSGFIVHPFIAVLDHEPLFNPDSNEVDYLIEVPLDELMDASAIKSKIMVLRNMELSVPYFDVRNEVIWGATAMILSEFLQLYAQVISDW